jgi:hypothetical protein
MSSSGRMSVDLRFPGYWVHLSGSSIEVWLANDTDAPSYAGDIAEVQALYPDLWGYLIEAGAIKPA